MIESTTILFLLLLGLVALLYSSVGHGGASGYLALMVVFSFPTNSMKSTALMLNLFVAGISFIEYFRKKHFNWKLFYPFAISSVPAAFIGGYISVNPFIYKQILAVFLLIAIAKLLGLFGTNTKAIRSSNFYLSIVIGAIIGFLSGLIGIGGGV
ncbi:MAG: sulfite exporter TauE/SafE family protein, partial [Bacteroidia bacterium]|nr:sulfite exporter TauE/SafE family protein [Bacteroidia bacterium]